MKPFPPEPELLEVARRAVWFKPPEEALKLPLHFIAHVLTYGTYEDVTVMRRYLSEEEFREAVEQAPPGIFDARSWAYWNIKIGRYPTPDMPKRTFT
jgi:hypothetical protein